MGEIMVENDEEADLDNDQVQTVEWLADKEDFERPAKLELVVGFLRLLCFLSVCTSVFGVIISILFPIQQAQSLNIETWDVFNFTGGDIIEQFNFTKTVRRQNPYYPEIDVIFTIRCTAGINQLTYLIININYLPLVLLIPKLIQLVILILGMRMSFSSCRGTVFVESQMFVDAFGNLCKFNFFYCILSQLAFFASQLTSFGIPFYRVHFEYGYDSCNYFKFLV